MSKHCKTGKIRYRDKLAAKIALSKMMSHRNDRAERRVYWCSFCRGWHTTSQKYSKNK